MLLTTKSTLWIEQFQVQDRQDAGLLLDKFKFVDADTFRYDLSFLLEKKLPPDEVAALYIEREEPSTTKRMYREVKISRGGGRPPRLRAKGIARPVVRSSRRINQIVGSEGVVANIATGLARSQPKRFIVQPSAELLREKRVRHLVIVTDFVGSGSRVDRFLSLLWNVRSIRSWKSYGKIKLWVFAYSATAKGRDFVLLHRASPNLEIVSACPTLEDSFDPVASSRIKTLCASYSPSKKESLGYLNVGALIAFAHGCPNDVPAIFHKDSTSVRRPWLALFSRRVTQNSIIDTVETDRLNAALDSLDFLRIKNAPAYVKSSQAQKRMIVVLCALSKRRRHLDSMTFTTGLRLTEIVDSEEMALNQGLLRSDRRLTDSGLSLLRKLQNSQPRTKKPTVPKKQEQSYYPTSLRAPR